MFIMRAFARRNGEVLKMSEIEPQEVIDFWIAAGPKKWWRKDPEFDAEIKQRFGGIHEQACAGKLDHWANTPAGALALILVLDQFSRNLFRDSPLAFAQDDKCAALARVQIKSGADQKMPSDINEFCYLPLMHSERLADQDLCLESLQRLGKEQNIKAAVEHRDIIVEFGRFPHRNRVLGRVTTEQEQAFLDGGGFSG